MSERAEQEAGIERAGLEEGEQFYLVLTGTLLDGFERKDVEMELTHLLRLPPGQVAAMLQGKRSRIRIPLERNKVAHLQGKVNACGAGCMIEPVRPQNPPGIRSARRNSMPPESDPMPDAVGRALLAGSGEGGKRQAPARELEVVPPVVIDGSRSETVIEEEVTQEMKAVQLEEYGQESGRNPEPERDSSPPVAGRDDESAAGNAPAASGSPAQSARRRWFSIGSILVLALVASGWGALQLWERAASPAAERRAPAPATAPSRPVSTPLSRTRDRMQAVSRQVRVWMIQFSGGFDTYQVTLERVQQDLGLTLEELSDGWGTVIDYQPREAGFFLISAGPDREFGTGDDLRFQFRVG
ncbi:MAG TPA: hypothetical protein ENK50_10540 [Sedimenticola sp.]|nr:hypothetical protein [Sedimenticola sp.]